MISLDEIFSVRQQLRDLMHAGEFEALTRYYAAAESRWQQDRDDAFFPIISQYTFLFTPQLYSEERIVELLTAWHQQQPQAHYPCAMLAQRWLNIAGDARGGHYADRVTATQWSRARISSDLLFYWAAKAISLNNQTPFLYYLLLTASGHFNQPAWFEEPHQPIALDLNAYSDAALAFAREKGGLPLSSEPIYTGLPVADEQEAEMPPLYWLNRALECDPQSMPVREQFIYYLYPRWYGDDEHVAIDNFLASNYCTTLPELKRNKLYSVKWLDKLGNPEHWPDKHSGKAIGAFDEEFQQMLALPMEPEDKAALHLTCLDTYVHFLLDDDYTFYAHSPLFARRIYESIEFMLNHGSVRLLFAQEGALLFWLLSVLCHKEYALKDEKGLFPRYIALTGARCENDTELLLSAYLRLQTLEGVHLPGPAEPWLARLKQTDDRIGPDKLNVLLNRLCFFQQKAQAQSFLTLLAEHDVIPALLLLSDIHSGLAPVAATNLLITPSAESAAAALDRACQNRSPEALFRKSRILEAQHGREAQPERLKLLEEATRRGHALAHYDYACALFWSRDVEHQRLAVEKVCAEVLLESRVEEEKLAYIAYLYAFGVLNQRGGMRKNVWLFIRWINYAIELWPDEHYQKMKLFFESRYVNFLVVRFLAKRDRKRAPEWQVELLGKLGVLEDE